MGPEEGTPYSRVVEIASKDSDGLFGNPGYPKAEFNRIDNVDNTYKRQTYPGVTVPQVVPVRGNL